jgi:3-oxoacyl-[acyl-carrier-protein] synthase III
MAGRKGFFAESLARALQKAGLALNDLDMVIASHAGHLEARWREDLQTAGLKAESYRNLRAKYGNLVVADTLADLAELGETGQIPKDFGVALWTACPGVQVASLVVRWLG